jgi:oligopeptide transport system substrate-binding protein
LPFSIFLKAERHKKEPLLRKENSAFLLWAFYAETFIPPGLTGFSSDALFPYNPAKARELFSLVPDHERIAREGITLAVMGINSDAYATVAEQIQANLGIPVNVVKKSSAESLQDTKKGLHDMAFGLWYADFPHAVNFIEAYTSNNAINKFAFKNQDYDHLVQAVRQTDDEREATENIKVAQNILIKEQLVIIPICHATQNTVMGPRVTRLDVTQLSFVEFKDVRTK